MGDSGALDHHRVGTAFLKLGAAHWSSSELSWLLGPTAWLVTGFTGIVFEFSPERGFVAVGGGRGGRACLCSPA